METFSACIYNSAAAPIYGGSTAVQIPAEKSGSANFSWNFGNPLASHFPPHRPCVDFGQESQIRPYQWQGAELGIGNEGFVCQRYCNFRQNGRDAPSSGLSVRSLPVFPGHLHSPAPNRSSGVLHQTPTIATNLSSVPLGNPSEAESLEATLSKAPTVCTGSRIKRPMNCFMLWSRQMRAQMAKEVPKRTNGEVSKILGELWKTMSKSEKLPFIEKAEKIRQEHLLLYPDYKYRPVRKRKSSDDYLLGHSSLAQDSTRRTVFSKSSKCDVRVQSEREDGKAMRNGTHHIEGGKRADGEAGKGARRNLEFFHVQLLDL